MNHIAQMCANLMLSFEAMSGPAACGKLKFGPFELSIGERLLRREGVVLPLGSRALEILIHLAECPGEVIAKKELIDHVWPDVTVEEGSLRVHVAAIRKALGDGQCGNRYIANIKGRGYSFVGTVVPLGGGTESRNDKFQQRGRAYHYFSREVEASNTRTIRRLISSCRHQLSRIAPRWSASSRMRQVMAHREPSSPKPMSTTLRYGIAVLSVTIAIGLDFFLLQYFDAKLTPFLFAVAATVWYGGTGPGVLAIVLSVLSLNCLSLHSFFSFSPIADLVYLTFCTFCALAVGRVSGVRRRTEQEVRQAHRELDAKISAI
jgi:DNA-binding winged helix-turn-helix (wHTH) protein